MPKIVWDLFFAILSHKMNSNVEMTPKDPPRNLEDGSLSLLKIKGGSETEIQRFETIADI